MVPNETLKLFYATTLLEFPCETITEFWRQHPIVVNGNPLTFESQLHHIWDESKTIEFDYIAKVFNDIEPLILSLKGSIVEFVDKFVIGLNKGSIVNVSSILKTIAPILQKVFSAKDFRSFSLRSFLPFIIEKAVPTSYCRTVLHENKAGFNRTVLAFSLEKTFTIKNAPYDAGLFIARPLQLGPLRFGLPIFDEVRMLADVARVEDIVTHSSYSYKDSDIVIGDIRFGKRLSFSGFCKEQGFSPEGITLPDTDVSVVYIEHDYVCPYRKRTVLHKGCIYGAPLYFIRLKYKPNVKPSEQFISPLISDCLDTANESWEKAKAIHLRLIATESKRAIFVFRKSDDTLFVNNKRLARFAPALMLRKIISQYANDGKNEFSNIEFSHDGGKVRENVSLRLQRIENLLNIKCDDVRIKKTGRGQFTVVANCPVFYREE